MTKIKVILRYDDFTATSDCVLERQLFDLLRKHELSCLVGIVPFEDTKDAFGPDILPLGCDKANMLREAIADGVVEPALHGYTHQGSPRADGKGPTEFQGVRGELQRQMLGDGKKLLEQVTGKALKVFIPPYNSYDKETVSAMHHVGLSILSGAMFDHAPLMTGVSFVPHTCSLPQLRQAVKGARSSERDDVLVVALFHPFDFVESDPGRGRMDLVEAAALFSWLAAQDDVEVVTAEHAAETMACGPQRYLVNREYLRMSMNRFVPTPAGVQWQRLRYLDSGEALYRYLVLVARTLLAYGVSCLIGVLVGLVFGGVSSASVRTGIYVFALVILLNVAWFAYLRWRDQVIYFKAAQVSCNLVCILGAFLVSWGGGVP